MTASAPTVARSQPPLLAVESIDVVLGNRRRATRILHDISLRIEPGEIVGLIGETGSGKTTLARTIVGLIEPESGRIGFDGVTISSLRGAALREVRRSGQVQFVFQDPLRALDPDLTVREIVGEGLAIRGGLDAAEVTRRVKEALDKVGLDATLLPRRPGEISGGQRQRVSIARAIVNEPRLLICDEPVSALDASNRNHILRLLDDLRSSLNLAIVVISHDLSSLAGIADRVVVLYRGHIVEDGPISSVFNSPRHPYTALLVASAPSIDHRRALSIWQLRRNAEDPIIAINQHSCVFATRCPFATDVCTKQPPLVDAGTGWQVACHHRESWQADAAKRSVPVS